MTDMLRKSVVVRQPGPCVLRLVAIGIAFQWSAHAVEILAHRGASYEAPENTLPAVRLAWELGADAVEVDIHQSLDGRIVAIHDRDTARVTGRQALVAELPFDKLRALDAGAWKGSRWLGTKIPALEEVLETVPEGKRLVVEIKCPASVVPELERVLDASGKRTQTMIIAFDYDTIVEASRRMPDVPCYWLYGFSDREARARSIGAPEDLIELVRRANLSGLDVRHDGAWVAEIARSLRSIGLKLYVYTVNSAKRARHLRSIGVDGITTDRPGFLRRALESE